MSTSNLQLPPQGVLIAWVWDWEEKENDDAQVDFESREQYNPYIQSESEESGDENTGSSPVPMHTVTFKCIGSTHDCIAQECLCEVSKIMREGGTVETKIMPEPHNQYDSKAIAICCKVNDEWKRIVRECLEHVHAALSEKRLLAVKLAWAKYLVCWSYSGPGFYAGVDITIKGEWMLYVRRAHASR